MLGHTEGLSLSSVSWQKDCMRGAKNAVGYLLCTPSQFDWLHLRKYVETLSHVKSVQ